MYMFGHTKTKNKNIGEIMKHSKKIPFVITLLLIASCCTIMLTPEQDVGISSNPSGAKVLIDGRDMGTTPMTVSLARKNTHSVKVELDGFMPYEIHLTKSTSGWVFGNIIFGGIIGLIIDMSNGALYELTPEDIQANLIKSDTGMLDDDTLYIAFTMKPHPSWEKIGNLEVKNK